MQVVLTKAELMNMVNEVVVEKVHTTLTENRKKDARVLLLDKEEPVEFGSPEHVGDVQKALTVLTSLRDAYKPGSGYRMVFASAIRCLKNILEKHSTKPIAKTEPVSP